MEYLWILIVGGIFSFFASMGIGANDAANAFATSIGSRSLTMKQAIILASIFEASGSILMGGHVVSTIRKGIADYECFVDEPYVLMYGCMWVCLTVGLWLFLASKYEMPVSTTHSCVGAMIGMTLALKGPQCVIWFEEKETFPYVGGVGGIVLSWLISPLFSAIISGSIFGIIRSYILRVNNSFERCIYVFPTIVGSTIALNTFYIIYKGAKGIGLDDIPLSIVCAWSFGLGGGIGLLTIPIVSHIKPSIIEKYNNNELDDSLHTENTELSQINNMEEQQLTIENLTIDEPNKEQEIKYSLELPPLHLKDKSDHDSVLDDVIKKDKKVLTIHENAEKFDPRTEELFKSLQVFTAICSAFSHGANDVANAIGPFATMYVIYINNEISEESDLGTNAYWILALGGSGIALGLAVYGYKIIQAIGLKLCKITPSRGIAIELASALVVITGSRLEIPLSTTHCQVGATVGVAVLEDPKNCSGVNTDILYKTLLGWILTLIIVAITAAFLVSQGAYAPETTGYEL